MELQAGKGKNQEISSTLTREFMPAEREYPEIQNLNMWTNLFNLFVREFRVSTEKPIHFIYCFICWKLLAGKGKNREISSTLTREFMPAEREYPEIQNLNIWTNLFNLIMREFRVSTEKPIHFKGNCSACLWVNYSRPGRVWSVTSRMGTGISLNLFLQCKVLAVLGVWDIRSV